MESSPIDERRQGDDRPIKRDPEVSLTWRPQHGESLRLLPKHGDPLCILEWASQNLIKFFADLRVYTALIVTFSLFVQLYGPPQWYVIVSVGIILTGVVFFAYWKTRRR